MVILNEQATRELKEKLKRVENSTENLTLLVMRAEPKTRDNDILLMAAVWELQGVNINIPDYLIKQNSLAMPSSIFRVRRKIQNTQGHLLPTKLSIAQARGIKQEVMREHYRPKLRNWCNQ